MNQNAFPEYDGNMSRFRDIRINPSRTTLSLDELVYSKGEKELHHLVYELTEVSVPEIIEARKNHTPSFLLKENGKYYLATVRYDLNFLSTHILGEHLCATCRRMSAACDEEGGCRKVRQFARGIERYPWIHQGYEAFNLKIPHAIKSDSNCFVVHVCDHYER